MIRHFGLLILAFCLTVACGPDPARRPVLGSYTKPLPAPSTAGNVLTSTGTAWASSAAGTPGGWQTAISVSFAGATDPGLSANGTYTLAGLTVKRENAANDRVAMTTDANGIVISPTTSQYLPSSNVRTAPLLWFTIPVATDWTTGLRLSIRLASSSQSAFDNGHAVTIGVDSDSTSYASWCGQGTNGALGRLFNAGVAVNAGGSFANRSAGGAASTGVVIVTCEIPQILPPQPQALALYRDGVAAWPDLTTLSPVVGVSSLRSPFDAINGSFVAVSTLLGIVIAADAPGGAGDAYTVTVSDLRVDYRN